jgi:hypothetical protein
LARGSLRPGARTLRVEKFKMWRESEGNPLKFGFTVRSVDPQAKTIKGYTFVVLKPEKGCQEPAASFPQTLLENGRPTLFQRGRLLTLTDLG